MIVGDPGFLDLVRNIYQTITTFAVICRVSEFKQIMDFILVF